MKKCFLFVTLATLFASLAFAGCASQEDQATGETGADLSTYETGGLVVNYPSDWETAGGNIDFTSVQELDTLKLLTFQSAPKLGGALSDPQLSGVETFEQFKSGFMTEGSSVETLEAVNTLFIVDVITYETAGENGVYAVAEGNGVVAVWQFGKYNFALLDEGALHQNDGTFGAVLGGVVEKM